MRKNRVVFNFLVFFSLIILSFCVYNNEIISNGKNIKENTSKNQTFNSFSQNDIVGSDSMDSESLQSCDYNLEWYRLWNNDSNSQGANGITIDSNDHLYQVGYENYGINPNMNMTLLKYDSNGDLLWNTSMEFIGNGYGTDVAVDSLNNVYVIGTYDAHDGRIFLVKFDNSGNYLWNRTWNGTERSFGKSIVIDSFDNVYIACFIEGPLLIDILILKYNNEGTNLWERIWSGVDYSSSNLFNVIGLSIDLDSQNNLYVTSKTLYAKKGVSDGILIKYDSAGNHLWNRTWGGSDYDIFSAITIDSSDFIYVSGSTISNNRDELITDHLLVKYDNSGNQIWNSTIPNTNNYHGADMVIGPSNRIFVVGLLHLSEGGFILTTCFDSYGNYLWNATWGDGGSGNYSYNTTWGLGIDIDSSGSLYVSGFLDNYQGISQEAVLLKYSVNLLNAIFTTNKQLIYLNDNKVQFFFTGCDGYSPVSFQWNFGDGSSNSTARNPIHQYSEIGDYTVILTLVALNGDMDVFIRENYISVEGIDPSVVVISIVISICVVVGLITLGVVVYRRKRKKTSKVVSIDTDTQLLSSKIEKISNLFKLSQSVKIDDAAELIGISRKELLNILVENRDSLKGITINNDILTLSSVEDVSDFIELLDKQFDSWKDKEKSKLGKI